MSDIAYRYLPDKNPKGRVVAGVPLADIDQAQFDAWPEWVQRSVAGCAFYDAVTPPKTKAGKTAVSKSDETAAKAED